MDRIVGIRPSAVRERLGWEWIVESCLRTERATGGLEVPLRNAGESDRDEGVRPRRQAAVSRTEFMGSQGVLELTDLPQSSEAERSGAAA
jgi:hypothetical protein